MEILDPRTKDTTFLTLRHYNGKPDTQERAQCLLEKSEAFMRPQNLWIAAESFKLSLAPNPDGLVYYNVPSDWRIGVELRESDNETPVPTLAANILVRNLQLEETPKTIEIFPNTTNLGQANFVDYEAAIAHLQQDCNSHGITVGSRLTVDPGNNVGDINVDLVGDPMQQLQGTAFGPNQLDPIVCEYISGHTPLTAQHNASTWYMRVDKKLHPGLTEQNLKIFLSNRGNRLFYKRDAGAAGAIPGNYGRESIRILGPVAIDTVDQSFVQDSGIGFKRPAFGLYTKHKQPLLKHGRCYCQQPIGPNDANGDPTMVEVHSKITSLGASWVEDGPNYLKFQVYVLQGTAQGLAFPPPQGTKYLLLRRNIVENMNVNIAAATVRAVVEVTTNANPASYDTATNIRQYKNDVVRRNYTRFAGDDFRPNAVTPTYSLNHFLGLFNTGWGKKDRPYTLGVDLDGGFWIKVNSDNVMSITIPETMRIALGLDTKLTIMNKEITMDVPHQIGKPLVYPVTPIVENGVTSYQWTRNYDHQGTFNHNFLEGEIGDFMVVDPNNGSIVQPLAFNTPVGTLLRNNNGIGDYYKLGEMIVSKVEDIQLSDQHQEGLLDEETGLRTWASPPAGSFVGSNGTVSVGGFSTFTSIRLVIPDGIIFKSQLAGRTDARILAELRLPSQDPPSEEVSQWKYDPEDEVGAIMSSTTNLTGDIIWNSSASKQYLPVTSDNPIYRLNCEARLVYRDPTLEPKVVKLGYKDIFEVKLRLLQLQ